jgi:FHA domain-containing protein
MHLLIRAVSLAGQPLTQAISAYFDERGGTMGRSDTNTLALPDPERRISRLQAEVARTAEGWRLLNAGNANPIWHNNKAVAPGETVLLDDGDEIQVGTYSLLVSYSSNDPAAHTITQGRAAVDSRTVIVGSGTEARTDPSRMAFNVSLSASPHTQAAAARTQAQAPAQPLAHGHDLDHDNATRLVSAAERVEVQQPRPAPPAQATVSLAPAPAAVPAPAPVPSPAPAPAASPFADLLGSPLAAPASPSASDPFADLLSPSPAGGSPWSFASSAPGPAPLGAPAAPASSRLPDDFDPFADLSPARPASGGGASASPFDSLGLGGVSNSGSTFGASAASSGLQGLDLMGGLGGGTQGGSASSIDQLFGLSGSASSVDPLAGFLAKTAPAAPQEAAVGAPSSIDPLALLSPAPASPPDAPTSDFTPLPDNVPEVQGLMPLPSVVDDRVVVSGFHTPKAASAPAPAPAPSPAAQPDSFDALLEGLGAPTQPGGLSVQSGELPALAAQAQSERTVLVGKPLLVLSSHAGETAPDAEPLLNLSGGITLADPSPFDSLLPHQAVAADGTPTSPGLLDALPPATPMAPLMPTSAADELQTDHLALWSAFCQGAGVNFTPPQGLNPELMRVIGKLLRQAIDGSIKLVAARAATKQELRAEVTVIQSKGNNPLKFSPDAQSAMEQLLQPPLRGFMAGPDAVADAMDDLLGHTIGTMVGTRAALEGVLKRFEPEQLEAKLVGRSVMDSLLPMNRRAKLWELYLQHYESVRTEAQEDFHNLFGKAFLQAYEEQLDRLDAERRAAKTSQRPA